MFGILVPEAATSAVGISEHAYHVIAVALGSVSGFKTVAGMAILIYRRRVTGPVFSATTRNDKAMYVLLAGAIVAGLSTTVLGNLLGHPYDYRLTIAPYFRSIFYAHPDVSLINAAPIGFQIHVMLAWVLSPRGRSPGWCTSSAPGRLSHPALHRLPVPGRDGCGPPGQARLGAGQAPRPVTGRGGVASTRRAADHDSGKDGLDYGHRTLLAGRHDPWAGQLRLSGISTLATSHS